MIQVNENVRIRKYDALNWVVEQRHRTDASHRFSKNGSNEVWKITGYYPRLSCAVQGVVDYDLDVNAEGWKQVLKAVKTVGDELVQKAKQFMKEEAKDNG